MTLYIFTKDQENKNSCTGECLKNWPIFHAEKITSPAGSSQKEYGEFTRADGAKQGTFKGWPLYYFLGDKAQGDTKGQGVKQVWYVINPVVMKSCDRAAERQFGTLREPGAG
jgi:predicted lipoprotein with Yx(FWY)xxD motif